MDTTLDASVFPAARSLKDRGLRDPNVLFFMGTGVGTLPGTLRSSARVPLSGIEGIPHAWRGSVIHGGDLRGASVWLLDDAPEEIESGAGGGPEAPEWERAFPCWLAAAMGASLCVHTSAGVTLRPEEGALPVGALAVLSDHMNLSGRTPLRGLGETRLGPLFPDQTTLHHAGLRHKALQRAKVSGVPARSAIAACTIGPTTSTAAEIAWLATTGADVVVQGLADPLIACAHAGLAALAIVAVTDSGDRPLRMEELVARAEACAPGLEDLLTGIAPDVAEAALELAEEA